MSTLKTLSGYATIVRALKAHYRVRAAVRRQDAAESLANGPSLQPYIANKAFSSVIVPDNTKVDAYHEAAQGCTYIIHTASPLPTVPGDLVGPAVAGNKAILSAAQVNSSVKRVVFTASTSSLRPFERILLKHPDNQAILAGDDDRVATITADTTVPTQPPIPDDAPPFHRYVNSKIAATNLVYEFSNTSNFSDAHFSIVNIMPGFVLGPDERARSKVQAFEGSNMVLGWLFMDLKLNAFFNLSDEEDAPLLAEVVHLDDVTEAHINALDTEKVPGKYQNFLLCSETPNGPVWGDAEDIVRRGLPKEVEQGKIPFAGRLGETLLCM